MLNRRNFVVGTAGLVLLGLRGRGLTAQAATPITVYKSKSCDCCARWVDHLRASGFDPKVHDEEQMDQLKNEVGVPPAVRSCHTALVGAYLIEGHVPASDIRRLLQERPKAAGLAVPGMPERAPGMAQPGTAEGDFDVVAFSLDGSTRPFASH